MVFKNKETIEFIKQERNRLINLLPDRDTEMCLWLKEQIRKMNFELLLVAIDGIGKTKNFKFDAEFSKIKTKKIKTELINQN